MDQVVLAAEHKLRDYYLYLAVRGHLLLELQRSDDAASCFRAALGLPCSSPEWRFLMRKLIDCAAKPDRLIRTHSSHERSNPPAGT